MHARMRARAIVVAMAVSTASTTVLGHGGATGIVGDRMNGMMEMAQSIKSLSDMFDSGVADPVTIAQAADVIRLHAGETMIALFPEDSIEGPSEATPAIWQKWQEFSDLALRLDQLGDQLASSAVRSQTSADTSKPSVAKPTEPSLSASIWASLDERELLGLKPVERVTEPASAPKRELQPTVRDVFSAITETCASCHAKFRRSD